MDRSGVNTCQLALDNTHAKVSTISDSQVQPVSLFIPVLGTLKHLNVDDLVSKELVNQAQVASLA